MIISGLTLQTHKLAMQKDYYLHALKLSRLETEKHRFSVQAGYTRIAFEEALPGSKPVYHVAYNVPENQFADALEWMSERADLVTDEFGADQVSFEDWNAQSFYWYDPAGSILECIARHNLDNASEIPFSRKGLLGVTEIGVPVPSVPDAVDYFREMLGVPLYHGDGITFAAVGDEHGLLIIVPIGHRWYLTDLPAQPFPMTITVKGRRARDIGVPGLPYRVVVEQA